MTNFEKIKSMSIEELTEFLNEHGMFDNTPWMDWWDKNYCSNCESIKLSGKEEIENIVGITPFLNETYECAYCEVHDHCKFFPNGCPSNKEIIKMWLEVTDETN